MNDPKDLIRGLEEMIMDAGYVIEENQHLKDKERRDFLWNKILKGIMDKNSSESIIFSKNLKH